MSSMSIDTFGHMLGFLDIKSIESLQQTNQDNKNIISKFSRVYYENALIEKYGPAIIKLLKANDINYRKNIKASYQKYIIMNLKNSMEILEVFYNCIRQNKLKTKHDLFIMIYDMVYILSTESKYQLTNKDKLIKHRNDYILKNYKKLYVSH